MSEKQDKSALNDVSRVAGMGARAGRSLMKRRNAIGAGKGIAKLPMLLKVKIAGFLLLLTLIETLFFGIPHALYETIRGYFDQFGRQWLENYYQSDEDRIIAFFEASLHGIKEMGSDAWNNFTALLEKEEVPVDAFEMEVMGTRDAAQETYRKKIELVMEKVKTREDQIWNILYASCNNGKIRDSFYKGNFQKKRKELMSLPETRNVYFDGVTLEHIASEPSVRDAVTLIALYSALYNRDASLIEPSSLLRWLGYKGRGKDDFSLPLSESEKIVLSIDHWDGDYLPAYAMAEYYYEVPSTGFNTEEMTPSALETWKELMKNYRQSELDNMKCSAVDFLLSVSAQPIYSIGDHVTSKVDWDKKIQKVVERKWEMLTREEVMAKGFSPDELPTRPILNPQKRQYQWYQIPYEKEVISWIKRVDYHVSYKYPVSVDVRPVDSLIDLTSFYEASYSETEEDENEGGEE